MMNCIQEILQIQESLQIKILISIALRGRLSQKAEFRCKPSTISEAFKIMTKRTRLIEMTKHPDLERRLKREKFYKLSKEGLLTFIKKNPSPYEFWIAMIWYGALNSKHADRDEFNRYYNLFIQKFIGDFTLRSCFFLGNFFEKLFQEWRSEFDLKYRTTTLKVPDYNYYQTRKAYKVIECLLLNRRITIDKIVKLIEQ
ncbi:MAG: hypothetical protein WCC17_20315 [Candidatus Nitrosopolaris sp.]